MRKIMTLLMLILLIPSVLGLGIIPGRTNMNFEPGSSETVKVTVKNNEQKNMDVMIQVTGELAEYIVTSEKTLSFSAADSARSFEYTVNMPSEFDKPGIHVGEIKAVEKTIKGDSDDVSIKPNIEVISELFVNVPYAGKYAEARLTAPSVKQGQDMVFFIKVFNLGEEDIADTHVKLDIYDGENLLETLSSDSRPLQKKKSGELIIRHPSDGYDPGEYRLVATVYYDNIETEVSAKFRIDEFLIRLDTIGVDDYNLGGIAKISYYVTNIGNRLVEDFNTYLTLNDRNNIVVASLKSFDITLNPKDTKETVAYWNTENIDPGEYLGTLSLNYKDEEVVKNIRTDVTPDEIKIEVVSKATGFVVSEAPAPTDSNVGFLIIIIVLLAIIMAMAFWMKRKR